MPKEEPTTRLLMRDKFGKQRKLVTIEFRKKANNNSLMIYLPKNTTKVTIYKDSLSKQIKSTIDDPHSVHVTYHETGGISFACYTKDGEKIPETLGQLTQNLPLKNLSPSRCFLKITPYALERFPEELRQKRPTDVDLINDSISPHGLQGKPFEIHFWIGKGNDDSIQDKADAIRWFHINQSFFNSVVHSFQHDELDLQLFVAVVAPKEMVEFPDFTNVRIYTDGEAGFLKPKDQTV